MSRVRREVPFLIKTVTCTLSKVPDRNECLLMFCNARTQVLKQWYYCIACSAHQVSGDLGVCLPILPASSWPLALPLVVSLPALSHDHLSRICQVDRRLQGCTRYQERSTFMCRPATMWLHHEGRKGPQTLLSLAMHCFHRTRKDSISTG